ncbi:hypothetical protein D3C71_1742140 [compost metagenome]
MDAGDLFENIPQRTAGAADKFDTAGHLMAGGVDQRLDFLGGLGGALRQLTDFLGDDRKSLAGLACAGGLDAGIERQEIGLEGDVVDDTDNVGDLVG